MDKRTKQVRDAVMDMMSQVDFDEAQHRYTDKTGKFLAGVSSISDCLPKDFLKAWASKEAVKFLGFSDDGVTPELTKRKEEIAKMTDEQYLSLLKDAKGAFQRKSKQAMSDGHDIHGWCESYLKAKMRGEELPKAEGEFQRALEQFIEWEKKAVKEWCVSEARVASVSEGFAGCLDAIAVMADDSLAVIDFKAANAISDSYALQLAGYQHAFQPYGIVFDKRIIVRLPKTPTRQVYDRKARSYFTEPNEIEVKVIDSPYDFDRDVFLAARLIYKWKNFVEG